MCLIGFALFGFALLMNTYIEMNVCICLHQQAINCIQFTLCARTACLQGCKPYPVQAHSMTEEPACMETSHIHASSLNGVWQGPNRCHLPQTGRHGRGPTSLPPLCCHLPEPRATPKINELAALGPGRRPKEMNCTAGISRCLVVRVLGPPVIGSL